MGWICSVNKFRLLVQKRIYDNYVYTVVCSVDRHKSVSRAHLTPARLTSMALDVRPIDNILHFYKVLLQRTKNDHKRRLVTQRHYSMYAWTSRVNNMKNGGDKNASKQQDTCMHMHVHISTAVNLICTMKGPCIVNMFSYVP